MSEIFRRPESLLQSAPAFRALDEAAQRRLLADILAVAAFLTPKPRPSRAGKGLRAAVERRAVTRPDLIPPIVHALIDGTLHALVDASPQQMQAFAELLAGGARSVDDPDPDAQVTLAARLQLELQRIFPDPPAATP